MQLSLGKMMIGFDKYEIVREVRKRINKSIVENRTILDEQWSHSDEVEKECDALFEYLQYNFYKCDCERLTRNVVLFIGEVENYKMFNSTIKINFYVYNTNSMEMVDYLYNGGGYYVNGYEEKINTLTITLYAINNILQQQIAKETLVHELEHIMQISYSLKNNINYKKLTSDIYDVASNVIRNQENYSQADCIIAYLIYYSNSHEQDAFMQSYYQELKSNRFAQVTRNSETHNILYTYQDYYKWLLNNQNNVNLNLYKLYGVTYNNLSKYVGRQIGRFERKMKNIEKSFPLQRRKINN